MVRVAVLGAGHWGPHLIRNFHNQQTSRVRLVVDTSRERLEQTQARFPDVGIAGDAQEAFQNPDIDAVVIATPTSTHYELTKAALLANKHVLVEKPLATSSRHGDELVALADEQRRTLMVGHVFVYNEGVRRVRQYLQERTLGNVYHISMVRTNLGPIRMDVNAAWDLASHDISIANYWLNTRALAASASGGEWINAGIADAVFATLRYPHGVLVNLHVSWLNPRKSRDVTVVGDTRMLTFDDMNLTEPIRIYDKHVTDERTRPAYVDTFASFRSSVRDGDIRIPKVPMGEPLRAECEHFLECITSGRQPETDGRCGTDVVRVLEAIDRSIMKRGVEETVS